MCKWTDPVYTCHAFKRRDAAGAGAPALLVPSAAGGGMRGAGPE